MYSQNEDGPRLSAKVQDFGHRLTLGFTHANGRYRVIIIDPDTKPQNVARALRLLADFAENPDVVPAMQGD